MRLILRYAGPGPMPAEDLARIRALPGVTVVDESPRMILVDGAEEAVNAAVATMTSWVISEEKSITLPKPALPGTSRNSPHQ